MKRTFSAALLGFLIPVIGIMSVNAWQDPFRYYRWIDDSTYSANARWQNPGMIRNYSYDSALIGTSRFEYFKPSMFAPAGWKVLKVTAPGSMANEQLATLEMVLRRGQVARVIIEMSHVSYTSAPLRDPAEFPEFLYQSTFETPFQYLLSYDLLMQSIFGATRDTRPLDELYVHWPEERHSYNERSMLAANERACRGKRLATGKRLNADAHLTHLEQLIAGNPEIDFIAVFAPLSALALGDLSSGKSFPEGLNRRLAFRESVARIAATHENVILYDFATDAEVVLDLSRYRDLGHFDMAVVEQMASEIISGTGRLADLDDVNRELLNIGAQVDASKLPCRDVFDSDRDSRVEA